MARYKGFRRASDGKEQPDVYPPAPDWTRSEQRTPAPVQAVTTPYGKHTKWSEANRIPVATLLGETNKENGSWGEPAMRNAGGRRGRHRRRHQYWRDMLAAFRALRRTPKANSGRGRQIAVLPQLRWPPHAGPPSPTLLRHADMSETGVL